MLNVHYKGLRIEPTLAGTRELLKHDKDLTDVLEILNEGYECSASKRKENIIERCIRRNEKEFKVVVGKTKVKFQDGYEEDVWRLIHFGIVTFKKR
ncbi:MAG: hypothetical protein HY513_03910 [Candidatus Aenigmarchaeota archaeon]|nr:hypothetical protein [Candidatus Aenigmarchaeota archaeon]